MIGVGPWTWIGVSAASLAQTYPQAPPSLSQSTYTQPTYAVPVADPWAQYKGRLIALARIQGIRESTIQATIPSLDINRRVIALDHAEPRAASSGGVPSMQPYMRTHVTDSLIRRGQSNYANLYQGLRTIE